MANPIPILATGLAVAETLCNPPEIGIPTLPDILALILAALEALGIQIPQLPTLPTSIPFCPLD